MRVAEKIGGTLKGVVDLNHLCGCQPQSFEFRLLTFFACDAPAADICVPIAASSDKRGLRFEEHTLMLHFKNSLCLFHC